VITQTPLAGTPVLRLLQAPGAILRNSRAFPGTSVFLSAAPGELKSFNLQANDFENATTPAEER
jgi:hypothetical protein